MNYISDGITINEEIYNGKPTNRGADRSGIFKRGRER